MMIWSLRYSFRRDRRAWVQICLDFHFYFNRNDFSRCWSVEWTMHFHSLIVRFKWKRIWMTISLVIVLWVGGRLNGNKLSERLWVFLFFVFFFFFLFPLLFIVLACFLLVWKAKRNKSNKKRKRRDWKNRGRLIAWWPFVRQLWMRPPNQLNETKEENV